MRSFFSAVSDRRDSERRRSETTLICCSTLTFAISAKPVAPLSVPFAQFNRKTLRWEEVSEALLCVMKKKPGRNTTWPFGRNSPIESTGYSIYFPIGAGAGATTSLCCAQAPSSKAVTRTATIMIIFRNFNLSRLLSSQVAPFRLGGELRRSNAFLHFFEPSQFGRPGLFRVAGSACACGHYFLLLLRTSSQSQGG